MRVQRAAHAATGSGVEGGGGGVEQQQLRQGSHSNCAFNCQRCALGVQKKLTHSSGDKELANWTSSGGGDQKGGAP